MLGQCSRWDAQQLPRRWAAQAPGRGDPADLLLTVDSGSLRPAAGERSLPALEVYLMSEWTKRLAAPDGIQLSTPSGRKPKRSRAAAVSPLAPACSASCTCFFTVHRAAEKLQVSGFAAKARRKTRLLILPLAADYAALQRSTGLRSLSGLQGCRLMGCAKRLTAAMSIQLLTACGRKRRNLAFPSRFSLFSRVLYARPALSTCLDDVRANKEAVQRGGSEEGSRIPFPSSWSSALLCKHMRPGRRLPGP